MKNKITFMDRLTFIYLVKVKKQMLCPNCINIRDGLLRVSADSKMWKCDKCNYKLSSKALLHGYIFWFCDDCNSFLNTQKGFNYNSKKWKCTKCGFNNTIDKTTIKH